MSNTTSFSTLLAAVEAKPARGHGVYVAQVTDDWLQGRAGFGGLMAALGDAALRQEMAKISSADKQPSLNNRPLRSMMTAFVGPPGVGEVVIQVSILRSGKSVTWAEAKISQNGSLCTSITACFGGERSSSIAVMPASRPEAKPPEEATQFPFLSGITPNFTQHFDMRWASGDMPISGSKQAAMGVWVRFINEPSFDEAHIVAMMDVLPPAVLSMFTEMKPISSLTWHLQLLSDLSANDASDSCGWWYFDVASTATANGYSQQQATLYTPAGRAIAYSQQNIAVFG